MQADPIEPTNAQIIVSYVIVIFFVLSATFWWRVLRQRWSSPASSLVRLRERQTPFWSPVHFLIGFGLYIFSVSVLGAIAIQVGLIRFDAEQPVNNLVPQLLANTLGGAIAVGCLIAIFSAQISDAAQRLGCFWQRGDGRLGFIASVMILPPVMILSGIVSQLVPYSHPVLDSLEAQPSFLVFSVMLIGTAIITPLVEEFLFRVLLQGGLQGIADRPAFVPTTDAGIPTTDAGTSALPATGDEVLSNDAMTNPYAIGIDEVSEDSASSKNLSPASSMALQPGTEFRPRAWWPILIASFVFAGMHMGQGAAPIPLFFLSLGLGYLYRQTGNITAPFVVHAVLNFITIVATFAEQLRS